jgi:hypothetical protein
MNIVESLYSVINKFRLNTSNISRFMEIPNNY